LQQLRKTRILATDYAKELGIARQYPSESDDAFRIRVSEVLRDHGHLVEAHEVYQDKLYNQDDNILIGLIGSMAQEL
jgi:hypothetical protein